MNNLDTFLYEKRFIKLSAKELLKTFVEKKKGAILRAISKSAFRKKLHPIDLLAVEKNGFREKYKLDTQDYFSYNDLELKTIKFFEAVEIDNFERYKYILLNKFKDQSGWRSDLEKSSLKARLDEIKTSMDSVAYGGEIHYLKFNDDQRNDLLEAAHIGYIKTFESYFILTIEIKPSKKFKEIFKSIITAEDLGLGMTKFNSALKIVKTGIFVSHTTDITSSISYSLNNLLHDLNHQVKEKVANHLNGLFNKNSLPRIEYYEVENMDEFQKDKNLERLIGDPWSSFVLDDNKIKIITPIYSRKESHNHRVIKERGHGKREHSTNDLTDYDWVETHFLIQSLSLPCALEAILNRKREEFNNLKRKVYDYINEISKNRFINKLNFFRYSRRYVTLKIALAKDILTFKRFEDEFSTRNLKIFSREPSLDIFKNRATDAEMPRKEKDLQTHFEKLFQEQIGELNRSIEILQLVFKPIEDLSVYRTNFWLQIISISIGLLAIILTLDKAGEILVKIFHWAKGVLY